MNLINPKNVTNKLDSIKVAHGIHGMCMIDDNTLLVRVVRSSQYISDDKQRIWVSNNLIT